MAKPSRESNSKRKAISTPTELTTPSVTMIQITKKDMILNQMIMQIKWKKHLKKKRRKPSRESNSKRKATSTLTEPTTPSVNMRQITKKDMIKNQIIMQIK